MTMPDDAQHADMPPLDFRKRVLDQFQADCAQAATCQYDAEFVSTYLDQQLHFFMTNESSLKTSIHHFETHLPACPPCHDMLGNLDTLRETYRSYCYRLEDHLMTWSVKQDVLTTLSANKKNVFYFPLQNKRGLWQTAAAAVLAGAIVMVVPNPFTHNVPSAPMTHTHTSALSSTVPAETTDVVYQTPEAYLFSKESDTVSDDTLNQSQDESIVALSGTGRI